MNMLPILRSAAAKNYTNFSDYGTKAFSHFFHIFLCKSFAAYTLTVKKIIVWKRYFNILLLFRPWS